VLIQISVYSWGSEPPGGALVGDPPRGIVSAAPIFDVKEHWVRHTIAEKVPRTYGVGLCIGDLDNDGRMDVVLAQGSIRGTLPSDGVFWWQSRPDPKTGDWSSFRITPQAKSPHLCQATEACDLDGDGDVDVVAVSPSEDATVFLSVNPLKQGGNVRAEWQTIVLDGDGGECERIVCEDVDADGWKDLVYILGKYGTTRHDASVDVLFNPGDGDISQAWRKQTIGNAYERDPNREKNGHGVLVTDVDQDGHLDILSACGANRKSGVIFWFRNPGPAQARGGSWNRCKISEDSKINYGGLQLDDVNNDGWVDLFATESHGRDCDGVVQKCPGDIYWFQHPGADPTGDWNRTQDVASLRKTWHAMIVGAAIQQGRIPTYCQPVRQWVENPGDERVTWWHLITQTSALDYPHTDYPDVGDPAPGEVWTYSDKNPRLLWNALARVYGKTDFRDNYADVAKAACFDAIGMRGWSARPSQDGVRFHLDLEDMGRLGLLALARGCWQGQQLVPRWFVEELETKQTRGTRSVYNGPDDGNITALHARRGEFPQCPYGFMTWVNTDGDFYPGADRGWAWGAGAGGTYVLWNYRLGIVLAGVGVDTGPTDRGIPQTIERCADEHNPLVRETVGQWERWELRVPGIRDVRDPYRDVKLDVTLTRPDGSQVKWWGYYDGDGIWRIRFLPDQVGLWRYEARFVGRASSLPGSPEAGSTAGWKPSSRDRTGGSFECVASDSPGMLCVDTSNPIWFGHRGGGPVQLRGLHVGDRFFADNWPHAQRVEFLEWVRDQRYNLLSVASHYLNRDADGRGRGWQTPKLWPLDAAKYQRLETWRATTPPNRCLPRKRSGPATNTIPTIRTTTCARMPT